MSKKSDALNNQYVTKYFEPIQHCFMTTFPIVQAICYKITLFIYSPCSLSSSWSSSSSSSSSYSSSSSSSIYSTATSFSPPPPSPPPLILPHLLFIFVYSHFLCLLPAYLHISWKSWGANLLEYKLWVTEINWTAIMAETHKNISSN